MAVLGSLPIAALTALIGLLSGGYDDGVGVALALVMGTALVAVGVGVWLLLSGRSWRVLVVSSLVVAALVLAWLAQGPWEEAWPLAWLVVGPLATAGLGSLPSVRRWVAGRRATHS